MQNYSVLDMLTHFVFFYEEGIVGSVFQAEFFSSHEVRDSEKHCFMPGQDVTLHYHIE